MNATHQIDHGQRIIFSIWTGVVTAVEAIAAVKELMAQTGFSPFYDRVVDARGVTDVKLTKADLMSLAVLDPIYPTERRAIVTSKTSVFGVGRMFGLLTGKEEQGSFRVFYDYDKALEWIHEPRISRRPHSTEKMTR